MQPVTASIFSLFYTSRYHYSDIFDQMRARVTLLYSAFILTASVLAVIAALVFRLPNAASTTSIALAALLFGIVPQASIVTLVHFGRLRAAMLISLMVWGVGSAIALTDGIASSNLMAPALLLLYASLIWQWRGTLIFFTLETVAVVVVGLGQAGGLLPLARSIDVQNIPGQVLLDILLLLATGFLSGSMAYELRRALHYTSRMVAQLRATSEVAQRAATFIDLNELLKQTVNFIRDRFGFYHVQIFLIDPDQRFAVLHASTGQAGEMLLLRGCRLAVGSQSIVGQVTLLGEPVLSTITPGTETIAHGDEVLAETRSVLALPLIARDHILGVLDIQSARPDAFSQEDVESLGIMASHLSIAISNAQLFQEQRVALNENRRMFLEAQTNLREIQLLNQRLTGQAWEEYLHSRSADAVGYTLTNNQLRHDEEWSAVLQQAVNTRQPVISVEGNKQTVAVPVELRGRAIGAIEVETGGLVRQSDTLEMLRSVAQRLALSIDNARLFEQAQEVAQQELEVNAISAKLQGAGNMDDIVRTAVVELSRALGAQQAFIRLGLDLARGDSTLSAKSAGSLSNGREKAN